MLGFAPAPRHGDVACRAGGENGRSSKFCGLRDTTGGRFEGRCHVITWEQCDVKLLTINTNFVSHFISPLSLLPSPSTAFIIAESKSSWDAQARVYRRFSIIESIFAYRYRFASCTFVSDSSHGKKSGSSFQTGKGSHATGKSASTIQKIHPLCFLRIRQDEIRSDQIREENAREGKVLLPLPFYLCPLSTFTLYPLPFTRNLYPNRTLNLTLTPTPTPTRTLTFKP